MGVMISFFKHIAGMPMHWRRWVMALILVNLASVLFLDRVEARWVLAAFAVGGVLQMILFARFGFVRLLGLGHFPWLALILWLLSRLDRLADEPVLFSWILVLMVFNGLSLVIDVADVINYWRGDRRPTVVVE
jgi:hypothetical protein